MSDRIEAKILDVLGEEVAAAVDTPLIVIEGTKGDPGAPGKDGHSPVVTATKSGKTTTISVDGSAIATVEDGADGAPGKDGAGGITPTIGANGNWYLGTTDTGKPSRGAKGDPGAAGHSPAVTATKSGGVTTVKVDGEAVATINDGKNGKTPVRGTDYWTGADKQEMVNEVLAALPDGTEVSY